MQGARRSRRRWPLVLSIAVVLAVGFWWWIGGIRLSNPLPEMRSEMEHFVPPDGSSLVEVNESGLDRVCFLQCAVRTVETRFAFPDLPDGE